MFDFTKTNKHLKAELEQLTADFTALSAEKIELLAQLESLQSANSELNDKLEKLESVNLALAKEKEEVIQEAEKLEEKAVEAVADFEKKVAVASIDIVAQAGHEKIESVSNDEIEQDYDVVKAYSKIKDPQERFAFYKEHKKELIAKIK